MKLFAKSKAFLLAPLLFIPMMMTAGCQGCGDDFRLIRTCSYRAADRAPCIGTQNDYILYTQRNPDEYNVGVCHMGSIQCLRDLKTAKEHCPEGGAECLDEWDSIKHDDVCVGWSGPKAEQCDGIDNDCDGETDEGYDQDGDGYQDANQENTAGFRCGYDCDDNNPDINPSATEICDGVDNNCNCLLYHNPENRDSNSDGVECGCTSVGCDSNVDEQPSGLPITTVGICEPDTGNWDLNEIDFENTPCSYVTGKLVCRNGTPVCEGAEFVGPEPEICDGIDNNCNGFADEPGYVVGEGAQCGSDVGVCEPGYMICNPIVADMMCVDAVTGSNPDHCDGLDNDCDGALDEDAEDVLCTNGCPVFGYQYCVNGEYSVCDAPGPVSEDDDPCNGLDDDCDGLVDEGQDCSCDPTEIGPNAPDCMIGEMQAAGLTCGIGKKDCICENGDCDYGECYQACDPWIAGVPVDDPNTWWAPCPPEQCDAWDHNCYGSQPNQHIDGLIDVPCACDPNSPVPAIAQAALNGNCEEGLCTSGQQTCEFDNQLQQWRMMPDDCDAVGPTDEVCDELDNDCDGLIDEELNSFDKVDMVFAIDITGSMGTEIQAVHTAISAYAQDFMGTEHRFALLLYPAPAGVNWTNVGSPAQSCGNGNNNGLPYWVMTNGLVDVQAFLAALQTVLNTGLVCGSEPSYDVLSALIDVQDPAQIGWRNDAYPYVFLIGDEMAQTWTGITEASLAGPAQFCDGIGGCPCTPPDCPAMVNKFEVHCFVDTPSTTNQYDDICFNDVVGDNVYDISSISAEVLRDIFADVCLPGE